MAEERPQLDLVDVPFWLRRLNLQEGIGSEYEFVEAEELASQKIRSFRDGLDFPVESEFDEPFLAHMEKFRRAAEDMIAECNKRSTLRDELHTFLIAAASEDIPVAPGNNPNYRIVTLTDSWNSLTGNVMHYDKDFRPFLLAYLGSALLKVSEGCLVFKLDNSNSDKTRHVLKRFMAEHGNSSFIKKFQQKLTSNVVQLIQKELKEHGNISDITELAVELKKYTQVLVIGRVKDLSPAATSCSVMVALSHEFDMKNDLKKVEAETFVDMALQSSTLKLDKERVYDMFCAALRCKSSSLGHIRRLLNELEERDKDEAAAALETMKLGEASAPASKPGPSGATVNQPVGVIKPSEVLNIELGCLAIAHLPSGQLIHGGTYGLVGLDFIPDSDISTPTVFSLTVHADQVYVLRDRNPTQQLFVINLSTKQTQTFDMNTKYGFHSCVAVSDTKIYIIVRERVHPVEVYRVDTLEHQYDIPLPHRPTCLTVLPDDTLLVGFYSKVVRVRGDKSEYTELWRSGDCFGCFELISIVYDDKLDVMLCLTDYGRLYRLDLKGSVLSCDLPNLGYPNHSDMDLNGDDLYISSDEEGIFKYNIQEIRSTFTQPSIEDSSDESD